MGSAFLRTKKSSLFIIIIIFLIDQIIKSWVLREFPLGGSIPVFQPWLHLTRVNNTGAAFGLWKNTGFFLPIFSAVSFVGISYYLFFKKNVPNSAAWSFIAGGALGNLSDRVRLGYVIDYIDLRIWPVFNFADICICLGVGVVLIDFVRFRTSAA